MNTSIVTLSLILIIVVPIFGLNFLISFFGNILLLIFLVPLLIFLIALISWNSLKSRVITCDQCGTTNIGLYNKCINCGVDLNKKNTENFGDLKKPSETIIEVKAEEVN